MTVGTTLKKSGRYALEGTEPDRAGYCTDHHDSTAAFLSIGKNHMPVREKGGFSVPENRTKAREQLRKHTYLTVSMKG